MAILLIDQSSAAGAVPTTNVSTAPTTSGAKITLAVQTGSSNQNSVTGNGSNVTVLGVNNARPPTNETSSSESTTKSSGNSLATNLLLLPLGYLFVQAY